MSQETKTSTTGAARAERRRLSELAGTAIAVADDYRARGNHSRAKAMDEISAALRDLAARAGS